MRARGAERGIAGGEQHRADLKLAPSGVARMLDRRDSALQSARSLYANDDVVWNPGVLVVRKEIAYGKTRTPNHYLVAAGAWSYSLYLVHHEGAVLFGRLPIPNLGTC